MAYNLPPPWDPGFALPENVRDEGLERRAFVTKQLPRGTYDDPSVGTGGYAVPRYVLKEGYGQGAYVTKWAERGRYDIPVPHRLNQRPQASEQRLPGGSTRVTFGSKQLPAAYQKFGDKAAATILNHVQALPPATRKNALRVIMDSIDPNLWQRTADLARELMQDGHNAAVALRGALSRAMSTGAAAEVVKAGQTGQVAVGGIMGLGAYGRRGRSWALGDTAPALSPTLLTRAVSAIATSITSSQPTEGQCSSDGQFVFRSGGWARRSATDVCTSVWGGSATSSGGAQGGVTGGTVTGSAPDVPVLKMMQIGPFLLPLGDNVSTTIPWLKMTTEQQAVIASGISYVSSKWISVVASPSNMAATLASWPSMRSIVSTWPDARIAPDIFSGRYPLLRFTHPENGKKYGVFATTTGTPTNQTFRLVYRPYETAWEKIWDFLKEVAAAIVDVAKGVVDAVSSLACQLANAPNGQQIGAAIGVASGAGASTGAAGAAIVKGACYTPPPAPSASASSSSILPLAILGGAALVGVAVFSSRKKKAT